MRRRERPLSHEVPSTTSSTRCSPRSLARCIGETLKTALYSGRVTVEPHKYTDGHYLVVRPSAPADSAFRLIFETDGTRVTRFRSGLQPQVAWIEGCA